MKAGTLRHRIIIEKPVSGAANEFNERTTTWTAFAAVWASISPTSPKENEYAKRFAATVSHTITVRFLQGIKSTMRVNFNSRIFQINGVVNKDELGTEATIYATEII